MIKGGDANSGGKTKKAPNEKQRPLRRRAVAERIVRPVIERQSRAPVVRVPAAPAPARKATIEVPQKVANPAPPSRCRRRHRLLPLGLQIGFGRRGGGSDKGHVLLDPIISPRHRALLLLSPARNPRTPWQSGLRSDRNGSKNPRQRSWDGEVGSSPHRLPREEGGES